MNIVITLIQMKLIKQDVEYDENKLLYLHYVLNQSLVEYISFIMNIYKIFYQVFVNLMIYDTKIKNRFTI